MKMLSVKSQVSPILVSGVGTIIGQSGVGFFIQPFGEFEKVTNVMLSDDTGGAISGYIIFTKATIVSGNAVKVDGQKNAAQSGLVVVGAINSGYVAIVSGDLSSNTVTILAFCE